MPMIIRDQYQSKSCAVEDKCRVEYVSKTGRRSSVSSEVDLDQDEQESRKFIQDKNVRRASIVQLESTPSEEVVELHECDKDMLMRAIAENMLFRDLDVKYQELVAEAFTLGRYAKGDAVIRQGDEGHIFYVVQSGSLSIHKREAAGELQTFRGTYTPGDSFGELALMHNQPRAASITVESETCWLWQVHRQSIQKFIKSIAKYERSITEQFIAQVPVMSRLPGDVVNNILDSVQLSRSVSDSASVAPPPLRLFLV
eukprot:761704-Hanusia_phi.AAC.4